MLWTALLLIAALDGDARVLVVAADAPRAEEIYAGLRAAGLQSVSLEERSGVDLPPAPEVPLASKDAVRATLQDARAHLRELDNAAARAAVDAALDALARLERPEDAVELWSDALLFRASLALSEERPADARVDLLWVTHLEPGRDALHPGLYPPSLVEAYAAARAEQPAPTASLVVRPRAVGHAPVEVWVDARPWSGAALAPGRHLLTLHAPGAAPRTDVIDLDPSTPTILEPFLAPAGAASVRQQLTDAARTARNDAQRAAALRGLADACAARVVVLEQREGAWLLAPGRALVKLRPGARDGAAMGRAVSSALEPPRAPPTSPSEAEPAAPLWLWAGIGGTALLVVGAGAAGVALWALWPAEPQAPPPRPVAVSCCVD